MPVTTLHYLAYGSNLFPPRLAARIAIHRVVGLIALPDTALEFNKRGADGSGKCNLRARSGAVAYGVVYRIATADKVALDRIEGVGHGYHVDTLHDHQHGLCYFYRADETALDDRLRPYDWYKAYVLAGARHHQLPADYLAALAVIEAQTDEDAIRRRQNFDCLTQRV